LAKACGSERFAIDLYPEGLLWAGAKRAGVPHARINSLRLDAALRVPGVIDILTRADVPGSNRQGIVHKDQPVLCGSKVRHGGDPVALVLAETRQALESALVLIEMDLTPLPGVFDAASALAKGAPLVHEENEGGNILLHAVIAAGEGKKVLRRCPVRVRGSFIVPMQEHAFLETQNGVARLRPDGTLDMTVSTQAPFRDRFEIASALGLDPGRIRIRAPYLGGGFGGKDGATVQCLLALAALKAGGRPVKMVWEREESILAGYKRHAARLHYELGAGRDGRLAALTCRIYYDTGAYAHLGGEIMELGMEHAGGPYRIPNTHIEGFCVYTNNPVAGAFRGFGVAQTSFAIERMVDALAAKLDMDPLQLRLQNALRPGDLNCSGVRLEDEFGFAGCLEAIAGHPHWTGRGQWTKAARPFTRRGVGLACAANAMGYGRGLPDAAVAKLELTGQGRFRVYNAVADMGQGNAATFCQIAAEELGQELRDVELVQPDTLLCHPSGSSSASRTTYTFGNALIKACAAMRDKLFARAALFLLKDELAGLALLPGRVRDTQTGREVALTRMAAMLPRDDRVCVSEFLMPVVADPPATGRAFRLGFPHRFFSYAAHLCGVEVDELTGKVTLLRSLTAVEGGQVVNPQCFEQQVQGASAQGAGYALFEDFKVDQGRILAKDLSTYLIPTALDLPDLEVIAVAGDEPTGPHGLKGIGEVGLHGPLPAIASAVQMAVGAHLGEGPITPERAYAAAKRPRGKGGRK
jgi:CO/xanthine dehydrogenase Mo-binding subunit